MTMRQKLCVPVLSVLGVLLCFCQSDAQPKGFNYDETKVPEYSLPDPLSNQSGDSVDADEWTESRRQEILNLFKTHVYGVQPPAPENLKWEIYEQSDTALDGKAIRKQIAVYFSGDKNGPKMDILVYLPKKAPKPVPTFVGLNFRGNHTIHRDPAITLNSGWMRPGDGVVNNRATEEARGASSSRWPVEFILSQGFAVATIYSGDIDPDKHDEFKNGVHTVYPELQDRDDNFATISAWAWGLSRALDYFEHDGEIDQNRVAVIGHSRLGKTALWAGATDTRFAMAVSNNSGCGGAALARRQFGETVKRINTSFPHWFCKKHQQYNDNEASLPVDQHELIALIAPRLVYVASASQDRWADPYGEFLSAKHGSRVYDLLGKKGISTETPWPSVGEHLHTEAVGYHLRDGKHDVTAFDWKHYLDFAKERMK